MKDWGRMMGLWITSDDVMKTCRECKICGRIGKAGNAGKNDRTRELLMRDHRERKKYPMPDSFSFMLAEVVGLVINWCLGHVES